MVNVMIIPIKLFDEDKNLDPKDDCFLRLCFLVIMLQTKYKRTQSFEPHLRCLNILLNILHYCKLG